MWFPLCKYNYIFVLTLLSPHIDMSIMPIEYKIRKCNYDLFFSIE